MRFIGVPLSTSTTDSVVDGNGLRLERSHGRRQGVELLAAQPAALQQRIARRSDQEHLLDGLNRFIPEQQCFERFPGMPGVFGALSSGSSGSSM